MIKKIKIELLILCFLFISILVFKNIDISIYNKIHYLNNSFGSIYLKKFFVNITVIGDSIWVFLLSIFIYLTCYFLKNKSKNYEKIKIFSLFLFFATLISGILTQIIKHIVGRPRPNYAIEHNVFEITFFNFESSFHSFPSGHTSTIFVVALVLSIFTPKIKLFYLFFASLVAFSRIFVGAHFFTDIIGGFFIALITIKITLYLFDKKKLSNSLTAIEKLNTNTFYLSLLVLFIGSIFIAIGNSLDIYISNLFYRGNKVFVLQSYDLFTIFVRKLFLNFLIIYLIVIPSISIYFPIKKIYFNYKFRIKDVIFIFLCSIFNLVIVVNLIFKNLWGRARPNDIIELGGEKIFTPWYKISSACETNCSFVSGDASVGFSLIILFFLTKNKNFFWMALMSGGLLGITRILEGGHFFSDILMASIIIFIFCYFQSLVYNNKINKNV